MMEFFVSSAFAQEAASKAAPNPMMSLLPFVIIFIIFYFLMIRPQKRKLQEEQALLSSLSKGDEIFTKSGIIGTISGITDKIVTLEVSEGVKLKILRGQIGGNAKKIFEKEEKKK